MTLPPVTDDGRNLFRNSSQSDCLPEMNPSELAPLLEQMGCPPAKSQEMAQQLDKRARQLTTQEGRTYEEALAHLLKLMQQGWAAQQRAH